MQSYEKRLTYLPDALLFYRYFIIRNVLPFLSFFNLGERTEKLVQEIARCLNGCITEVTHATS